MACVVCEHCNAAVRRDEMVLRDGYSYHTRCHKCYVCSETNLQNADMFKGVIFCSGCSNRIFQGCSTARQVKTRRPKRPTYKENKEKEKRRYEKGYNKYANRVLELARLTATDSLRSLSGQSKELKTNSTSPSTVATAITNHTYQMQKSYKLLKGSVEMGTTTTVTKELLKHIHSPIDVESKIATPVKPRKKRKTKREKKYSRVLDKKSYCSDLRVAELGASTEIANMALRRPSAVPIIIQSETGLKRTATRSLSNFTQESDISGEGDRRRSHYSQQSSDLTDSGHFMNRTIASIIKIPYRSFKRNILDRSSLISVIMSKRKSACILHRFRAIFRHEITDHQRRGLKRLFSTINRRKEQYKLGWLEVMNKIPEDERLPDIKEKREKRVVRRCILKAFCINKSSLACVRIGLWDWVLLACRHFKQSHSYRCMRTEVMQVAGPTRSELAVLRKKLKNALCFNLCKGLHTFNDQYADILTSVARGQTSQEHGS